MRAAATGSFLLAVLLGAGGTGCGDDGDATCGDGELTVATGEYCDDGNLVSGDGCSATCAYEPPAVCGDGLRSVSEICDDGNTAAGDGCSATCLSDESCGNGLVDPGEACDDGDTDDGDQCSSACTVIGCGDGELDEDAGEVCDDGNRVSGDGCSPDCDSDETCGNGVLDPGEACDDGDADDEDGCLTDCTVAPPPPG